MSANNMFKNGFRFNGGSISSFIIRKIENFKGSAALLYGNGAWNYEHGNQNTKL